MRTGSVDIAQAKQVYKAIKIFHPHILEEIKPKIVKPEAVFSHAILLPALLKRFCELKDTAEHSLVGVRQYGLSTRLKTLFIAIVIRLYDPQTLTGIHSEVLRSNLAEELSKLLKTDRTWISQVTTDIRTYLNPHKDLPIYKDFKDEVNKIAKVLEIEFTQ